MICVDRVRGPFARPHHGGWTMLRYPAVAWYWPASVRRLMPARARRATSMAILAVSAVKNERQPMNEGKDANFVVTYRKNLSCHGSFRVMAETNGSAGASNHSRAAATVRAPDTVCARTNLWRACLRQHQCFVSQVLSPDVWHTSQPAARPTARLQPELHGAIRRLHGNRERPARHCGCARRRECRRESRRVVPFAGPHEIGAGSNQAARSRQGQARHDRPPRRRSLPLLKGRLRSCALRLNAICTERYGYAKGYPGGWWACVAPNSRTCR
jgi:hypothetical protein